MEEKEFVRRVRAAGGRAAVAGGWVRDRLRGAAPKDKDYVAAGLDEAAFRALFPEARRVGRSFPVFLLEVDGARCEVALARAETKDGTGYLGFSVRADGHVSLEDDLARRDTAMNAMALELAEDAPPRFIDPFGGAADIRQRRVRAVSARFTEDPVRALRAARQAADFGYAIEARTLALMRACRAELAAEPQERVFGELSRALAAPRPSVFFRALRAAELLGAVFPELFALVGAPPPAAFRSEGDAFAHTMRVVDAAARGTASAAARFAALAHDLGRGRTSAGTPPRCGGYEARGLDALGVWSARMTLPRPWRRFAAFVIAGHRRAPRLTRPGKIAALLLAMRRLSVPLEDILCVLRAAHGALPPHLENGRALLDALLAVSGRDAPPRLRGEAVGAWVRGEQARRVAAALRAWQAAPSTRGTV